MTLDISGLHRLFVRLGSILYSAFSYDGTSLDLYGGFGVVAFDVR